MLNPVKAFYSDLFVLPLPDGHRFPMAKYRLLRERVARDLPDVDLQVPEAATDGVLALAHTPDWIERLSLGRLTPPEQRAIGFPWSQAMVERSRRSVGATIAACRAALDEGAAVNLAGGTHHAGPDRGEGRAGWLRWMDGCVGGSRAHARCDELWAGVCAFAA